MDRLWAPWRLEYVAAPQPLDDSDDCFLCRGLAENADAKNLVLLRTTHSAVVLNRYPYNNGHLLMAPLAHKAAFAELSDAEALDGQRTLGQMLALLSATINPAGFNLGMNMGRVAGAGLPGHMHWHIVPRWDGDTNFMPIVGDTRVISQSLDSLYETLSAALATGAHRL